jgi:transposase
MSQLEQRANIKFMCRWGKSASETLSALQQVYGDTALKKSAVYDWFSRFKNGQEKLEDDQRSGRPSTSRTAGMIENVRQLIQCDRRMTIVELAQEIGISIGAIHAILSDDLKMRRVSAKFVPRQLTTDQKECRMMLAGDLFEKSTQDPTFLTKIVMGDESWVFAYDPEMTVQSAEWHTSSSPRPKKSRLVKSKEKVMLIAFFDIDGVVHHEFVPPGQTVNGHFYVHVLQRLRDAVRRKRRDKWQGEWFLHHDNAPSHKSLVVQQFLTEKSIPVITQPPYSPDLAPSDFWLFSFYRT